MNTVSLQPAYILHHRQFRNTSLIVDLLTPEHGRVSAVARGARTAKSRRRPLLQPFRPLLVSWTGRSELRTLTSVEESGMPLSLEGISLSCAYYASELALHLAPRDTASDIAFAHYVQALVQLVEAADIEVTLRQYELDLLDSLGLLPDLSCCDRQGAAVDASANYAFNVKLGQAIRLTADADENQSESISPGAENPPAVPGLKISGKALLAMHHRDFADAQVRREAKQLMRQLIAEQLGGQPLKSRALFETRTTTGQ